MKYPKLVLIVRAALPILICGSAAFGQAPCSSGITFSYRVGDAAPSSQGCNITVGNTTFNFTATRSDSWITVAPTSGSVAPNQTRAFTIGVAVSGLSASGSPYRGSVTIAAPGYVSLTIPVTVNVSGGPINPPPPSIVDICPTTLNYEQGSQTNPSFGCDITAASTAFNYSASPSTSWIDVSPRSGSIAPGATSRLTVIINPSSLGVGTFSGAVNITAPGYNAYRISITLRVTPPPARPTLSVSATSLAFQNSVGSPWPPPQNLTITSSPGGLPLSVAVFTTSGGEWLIVDPRSGTAPLTLPVIVSGNTLSPGTYVGRITISAPNSTASPVTVTVTLTVTGAISFFNLPESMAAWANL